MFPSLTKFTDQTFLISVTTAVCCKREKILSCKHAVKFPGSTVPTSRVGVWFFNQVHVVASRCILVWEATFMSILWLLQIFHWILCGISHGKSQSCNLHALVHHCIYRSTHWRNCQGSLKTQTQWIESTFCGLFPTSIFLFRIQFSTS